MGEKQLLIISIITNTPQFTNDIGDVIRLFYGEGSATDTINSTQGKVIHHHSETNNIWLEYVSVTVEGITKDTKATHLIPTGEIEQKRQLKRLIKLTCYQLLKELTGKNMPWGCLTGIRPTRLYRQQMDMGMIRTDIRHVFSSIFDVSYAKIDLLEEIIDTQRPYVQMDSNVCDLYIGIPFCTTRCSYCSFSSGVIGDGKLVEPYIGALIKEIEEAGILIRELNWNIRAVYFGGGTPTSISTLQLARLLETVQNLGDFQEWTVEAGRPDTLNKEKLLMMKEFPVSRISINPQTMNEITLQRIGRKHSAIQIVETFELARSLGFDNINMDLIAALPGENLSMFNHTLKAIRQLDPESITVHTLAIKRSSRLHEEKYSSESIHEVGKMVELGHQCAHEMGMKAYYLYRQKYMADNLENVGFSKENKICRYNIDNMEETVSVIATGAGAISKYVIGKEKRILRSPNVSNIDAYIHRIDEMIERKKGIFRN